MFNQLPSFKSTNTYIPIPKNIEELKLFNQKTKYFIFNENYDNEYLEYLNNIFI